MPTSNDSSKSQNSQDDITNSNKSSPRATGENPQPSITGVSGKNEKNEGENQSSPENSHWAYSIDYLRYSLPSDVGAIEAVFPHPAFAMSGEVLRPLHFYNQCVALICGRVDWNTEKPSEKLLVTMSGADCQRAVQMGVDMLQVLSHALYTCPGAGSVSRLDFAADTFEPEANPLELFEAWRAGTLITPAEKVRPFEEFERSSGEIRCVNRGTGIGARSSELYLRCYDKALEEGTPGSHKRVELETKGATANALAISMLISGIIPAGKEAIRRYVQCEIGWFNRLVAAGGEEVYMEAKKVHETDRQRWYREQIIPAIIEDLSRGSATGRWLRFQVQRALDDTEGVEQHGGVETDLYKNSPKGFRAAQILRDHEHFDWPFLKTKDKDWLCRAAETRGYRWDTKAQQWTK